MSTRIKMNQDRLITSTRIDHIYTNCAEKCFNITSEPVGFSDHNVVALICKTKIPRSGPKEIWRRMYKNFSEDDFISDVANIQWGEVLRHTHAELALYNFCKLFLGVCDEHAAIRLVSVRLKRSPWLDAELQKSMAVRNKKKTVATVSGKLADWAA